MVVSAVTTASAVFRRGNAAAEQRAVAGISKAIIDGAAILELTVATVDLNPGND